MLAQLLLGSLVVGEPPDGVPDEGGGGLGAGGDQLEQDADGGVRTEAAAGDRGLQGRQDAAGGGAPAR